MSAFAAQEAARTRLLARQRQEPDEDGFVTVTRGGRSGPPRHEEAQEKAEKQQKKQKGLEDFYRFQTREKRKEKAGELVRRFQDDRHKLKEMKERRRAFRVSAPDTFGTAASANDVCSRSRSGQRCRTIPTMLLRHDKLYLPSGALQGAAYVGGNMLPVHPNGTSSSLTKTIIYCDGTPSLRDESAGAIVAWEYAKSPLMQ